MAIKHLNIRMHGDVQGVNLRRDAKAKADELGITGFVRNEPDSTVYIEAEGDDGALGLFIAWLQEGNAMAKVTKVDTTAHTELQNYSQFSITF